MDKLRKHTSSNCFICLQQFSSRNSLNKSGKVPLVLKCGHSACDSCLTRLLNKPGDILICHVCKTEITISPQYNSAKPELEFPLNTFLLGQLLLKNQPRWDDNKISFSLLPKKQASPRTVMCHECVERRAEFNCVQCTVPYCATCFTRVHQSAKAFKDHIRSDLTSSDSVNIEVKCPVHVEQNKQFWCDQCSKAACSLCLIGSHSGHSISLLTEKNLNCFKDMLVAHVNVYNVQTRPKATRKKAVGSLTKSENGEYKGAEKEMREHFARLHGLLIAIENKLLSKLYSPVKGSANSLKNMVHQIASSIEELEELLLSSTALIQNDMKYLNCASYYDVLEKLRKHETTPCHLLISSADQDTSKFMFDESIFNMLEEHAYIDVNTDVPTYRLVTQDQLPPDFTIDPIKSISIDNVKGHTSQVNYPGTSSSSVSPATSVMSINSTSLLEHTPATEEESDSSVPDCGNKNFDELVEGCKVKVLLTHAVSPSNFFVRRVGLEKKLLELNYQQSQMNLKIPTIDRIKPGHYLMAQFSQDSRWYRSVVLEIADSLITVFYIDFGNTETVKREKLRLMPPCLMKCDGMAVHCGLYDCRPIQHDWAPQAISTMLKIVECGELSIVIKKRTSNLLHVDMMKTDSLDCVNVRDALTFLGYAKPPGSSSSNISTENRIHQRSIPVAKTFENGHVMDATITHFVNPYEFYVRDVKSTGIMSQLSGGLQEMYSRKSERMLVYHPKIDMIVAAMNNSENLWRRAKILSIPQCKMVEVKYIDFGDTEIISFKRIRYLGQKFFKIGLQCLRCSLLDVAPLEGGDKWTPSSCEMFDTLLQDSPEISHKSKFLLVVHSYREESYCVVLFKEQGDTNLCINTALVNENHAISTGPNSTALHIPCRIPEGQTNPQACQNLVSAAKSPAMFNVGKTSTEKRLKPLMSCTPQVEYMTPAMKTFNTEQVDLGLSVLSEQAVVATCDSDVVPPGGSYTSSDDRADGASCSRIQPPDQETSSDRVTDTIKIPVHIIKVISPSEFYITPTSMVQKLKHLKTEMQNYYNKNAESLRLSSSDVKQICVIRREVEEDWCRAIVVTDNKTTVEVLLPDFGERIDISKEYGLYKLADKFQTLRDGATRCHMGGLKQPFDDRWPMTSTDEIQEFAEKYDGKIYITKLGQERGNSMPVEVLMKEEKVAGALEPMRVTWISLNNNLRMRGLALSDGTIDWDLEDYKYVSFQKQVPRLKMDIYKGIPIVYGGIADNSEVQCLEDITTSESVFGSTIELAGSGDALDAITNLVPLSIDRCKSASVSDSRSETHVSEANPSVEPEEKTSEEVSCVIKIPSVQPLLPLPTPVMPKSWPPALRFAKLQFIANPTNVNYEGSVFIQDFQKSVSTLKRIGEILDSSCKMSLPMPHDMYWSVGQTCIVKYHLDKRWYRGVIKSIKENNSLMVELVDYGNTEECSAVDLRKMPLATDIPIQGQFCTMKNVKPNNAELKWTIPVLDRIHALVVEKHCLAQLTFDSAVEGYDIENLKMPDGCDMLSYLVKEGLAVYNDSTADHHPSIMADSVAQEIVISNSNIQPLLDNAVASPSETNGGCLILSEETIQQQCEDQQDVVQCDNGGVLVGSWAKECEDFLEANESTLQRPVMSPVEQEEEESVLPVTGDSIPALLYNAPVSEPSVNYEPSELDNVSPEHIVACSDNESPDFEYLYLEIPELSDRFDVEVGALMDVDTITFQIVNSNDLRLNNSRDRFLELTETLQTEAPLQPKINFPRANDMCCAKFSADSNWYRAQIEQVLDVDFVLVKYVDYGNMEKRPLSEIREMKEAWTMVEVQAYQAKLHNVVEENDSPSNRKQIKFALEEALFFQRLSAIIIDREPCLTIELYNGLTLAYQDIIDRGLLKLVDK